MSHQVPEQFRPASAKTWPNPWPMYCALRDHDPVHHVVAEDGPGGGSTDYYVLSRHADIWSAASDHETFSSDLAAAVKYGDLKGLEPQDSPATVMQDSPEHAEFRKLIARGFTPRHVEHFEPAVREFVVERIERLRADGGGDIAAQLFWPVPSMVIAHYLGVPEEDRMHFYGWTEEIVAANIAEGGVGSLSKTAGQAFTLMMAYFAELIKLRRRVPGDDTISQLVMAGIGGDGDLAGMLSMLAFVFAMVASGIDTTTGMLGGAVQLLHQRPDQRYLLVENPGFITDSIDEFLRLTSPVQLKTRIVTRDVTIRNTTIPEGHTGNAVWLVNT